MPVHGNAQYFSKWYGPDKDQASSYPSQNSGSDDEAEDEGLDVGSSNKESIQDDEGATEEEVERLWVRSARGKDVASKKGEEPQSQGKLSVEERWQRCQDLEKVHPLTLDGEDFSKLPETGQLKYYDDSLDRRFWMYNLVKYKEIETLDDITDEGRLMIRNCVQVISSEVSYRAQY